MRRRSVFREKQKDRVFWPGLAWLGLAGFGSQRRHLIISVCVFSASFFSYPHRFFPFEVKVCQCHSHSFPFAFVARHRERQQQIIRTAAQFTFLASHCESDPVLHLASISRISSEHPTASYLRYPKHEHPQFIDSACWRLLPGILAIYPRLWSRIKRILISGHKP